MSQLEGLRPSSGFRHEERGDLGSNLDCARYPWRCIPFASGTRCMCGRLSYETLAGAFLVHGVFAGAAALWSLSARPLVARAHSLTGTFVDKRGA